MRGKKRNIDMTSGPIWKLLIYFAVPLLIGNLFQQLYNTVDSLVVGNFVGTEALAAVGATTSVINTLVKFFNGVSIGASVVIGQCYGAQDRKRLHTAVETTMAITFIFGIAFSMIGYCMAPLMLRLMSTPEDVMGSASLYLKIYFSGLSGLMIYNMGSAILRAVGDTKRPLLFLCFSSLVNIVLDLVFVIVFGFGIAGVAFATIIAQFSSALLVLWVLSKNKEIDCFIWKDLCLERSVLKQILIIGLPTGLQQSLTSLSNVFVHGYINWFGAEGMAGWSCYSKLNQFVMLPLQSMGQASTTFVSQNVGAGNEERARRGTRVALGMAVVVTCCIICVIWTMAPRMVLLFNREQEVIDYGVLFIRQNVCFTVCCCINQVLAGALRGRGNARIPMVIMLSSQVVFRQIYLFVATSIRNTPEIVGFAFPAGWIVCATCMICYYICSEQKSGKRLEE